MPTNDAAVTSVGVGEGNGVGEGVGVGVGLGEGVGVGVAVGVGDGVGDGDDGLPCAALRASMLQPKSVPSVAAFL